jgi:hypothetical protein
VGLFFAWAIGEGILVYRWGRAGAPPTPGVMVQSSAVFAGLAVVAAYQPARLFATALAFGYDLAILLQVVGNALPEATGWPPAPITNVNVTMPGAAAGEASASASSGSSGSSQSSGKSWNIWTGYL